MSPLYSRGFLEYHCPNAPLSSMCRDMVRITSYHICLPPGSSAPHLPVLPFPGQSLTEVALATPRMQAVQELLFIIFWTSEYGVSWVRGPPEGPKSCHQDARRPSGTLQRSPSLALQCIRHARGVWDLVDDHQFKSFSEVTSRGQLSVLLKRR